MNKQPPAPDHNPLTDEERLKIQREYRGRETRPGRWRNFCIPCGMRIEVAAEFLRWKTDMMCHECTQIYGNIQPANTEREQRAAIPTGTPRTYRQRGTESHAL